MKSPGGCGGVTASGENFFYFFICGCVHVKRLFSRCSADFVIRFACRIGGAYDFHVRLSGSMCIPEKSDTLLLLTRLSVRRSSMRGSSFFPRKKLSVAAGSMGGPIMRFPSFFGVGDDQAITHLHINMCAICTTDDLPLEPRTKKNRTE